MREALPLYLDYMATTPIDPRVVEVMLRYMGPEGDFGNPASTTHLFGKRAAIAVEHAREQIATTVGANPAEIVFTSGATEANNLAILGAAHFYQRKGRHVITMSTEHKAVLDSFKQLEKEGFRVTRLPPKPDGLLEIDALREALSEDTILVSVMHVNNEIGVIQDIGAIGSLLRERGIVFHVDAAQSAGKVGINLQSLPVDLMAFSAHKNYGPKGVGALYVRHKPRIRLTPRSFGGGQEGGLRAGTLATHQIAGMGEAFAISEAIRHEEQARLLNWRYQIWDGISHLPGIRLNGHPNARIAGNLNLAFEGLDGDALLLALSKLALSSTSACRSASTEPSYVLRALGLTDALAHSAVRLSLGRFTLEADIPVIINTLCTQVTRLKDISPL